MIPGFSTGRSGMVTVIVGERGQITIPKEMRKRLGIAPKSPVLVEIRDEGLFIRPAVTVGLRRFTDREIEEMVREDALGKGERNRILAKWKK
jgi:AbrB family looped-hinge helix DNA binding protein